MQWEVASKRLDILDFIQSTLLSGYSMNNNPSQSFFQQLAQAPLSAKIAATATLALGGAIANVVRDSGKEALGNSGSIIAAAIPVIVALFAIALMFKIPWRLGITLAVTLVVASFSFEEFPKFLEPRLGPGFLSHLVGGCAAVLFAAVCAVILGKSLGGRDKKS